LHREPIINIVSDSSEYRDKENQNTKSQYLNLSFNAKNERVPTRKKNSDYVYGNENPPKKVWSKNQLFKWQIYKTGNLVLNNKEKGC
jgi:hypothetical protein